MQSLLHIARGFMSVFSRRPLIIVPGTCGLMNFESSKLLHILVQKECIKNLLNVENLFWGVFQWKSFVKILIISQINPVLRTEIHPPPPWVNASLIQFLQGDFSSVRPNYSQPVSGRIYLSPTGVELGARKIVMFKIL